MFDARTVLKHAVPVSGFLLLLTCGASAASPSQLYGKSVVVTWTDDRVQRFVGQEKFHNSHMTQNTSVYISTAGRPFKRHTVQSRGGAGSRESVGGSPERGVDFQEHALLLTTAYKGGAMRIQIDFDENFRSCTAAVLSGKEPDAGSFIQNGLATGRQIEVQSSKPGAATCSIKDGNVFAE
jgi:hypothetical protein